VDLKTPVMDINKTLIIVIDLESVTHLVEILQEECKKENLTGISIDIIDGRALLESEKPLVYEFLNNIYHHTSDEKIFIENEHSSMCIEFININYITGHKGYTTFHLKGKRVVTDKRLLIELEKLLPKDHFRKCHRETIVNLDEIKDFHKIKGRTYFEMNDGDLVLISYRENKHLKDVFKRLKLREE